MTSGSPRVQLTYLPIGALKESEIPLVSVEGRYTAPRRGEHDYSLLDVAFAFNLPGQWVAIDIASIDVDMESGELTLPMTLLGLTYNEVSVTYTAGLASIGDDVKAACAQIVRNAQATPALNASKTRIDTMQMEYFCKFLTG